MRKILSILIFLTSTTISAQSAVQSFEKFLHDFSNLKMYSVEFINSTNQLDVPSEQGKLYCYGNKQHMKTLSSELICDGEFQLWINHLEQMAVMDRATGALENPIQYLENMKEEIKVEQLISTSDQIEKFTISFTNSADIIHIELNKSNKLPISIEVYYGGYDGIKIRTEYHNWSFINLDDYTGFRIFGRLIQRDNLGLSLMGDLVDYEFNNLIPN